MIARCLYRRRNGEFVQALYDAYYEYQVARLLDAEMSALRTRINSGQYHRGT